MARKRISEEEFQRQVNAIADPLPGIGKSKLGKLAGSRLLIDSEGNRLEPSKITAYRIEDGVLYFTIHGKEIPEANCFYPI